MFHMKQTPPTLSGWRGFSLGEWPAYRVAMRVGMVNSAAASS